MNRRSFITSGCVCFLSYSFTDFGQRPTLGLDFELSSDSLNTDPSTVDSLLVHFSKFDLTPRYLDDTRPMGVTVAIEMEDGTRTEINANGIGFDNGQTVDLSHIASESSDVSSLLIDDFSTDDSYVSGDIEVIVVHPSISSASYTSSFSVSDSTVIPDSAIHSWRFEDGSGTVAQDSVGSNDLSVSDPVAWVSDSRLFGGSGIGFDRSYEANGDYISTLTGDSSDSLAFTVDHSTLSFDDNAAEHVMINTDES